LKPYLACSELLPLSGLSLRPSQRPLAELQRLSAASGVRTMAKTAAQKAAQLRREAKVLELEEHAKELAAIAEKKKDPAERALAAADALMAADKAKKARRALSRRAPRKKDSTSPDGIFPLPQVVKDFLK